MGAAVDGDPENPMRVCLRCFIRIRPSWWGTTRSSEAKIGVRGDGPVPATYEISPVFLPKEVTFRRDITMRPSSPEAVPSRKVGGCVARLELRGNEQPAPELRSRNSVRRGLG